MFDGLLQVASALLFLSGIKSEYKFTRGRVVTRAVCVPRLLETETACPMCSETLSVKQVKKVSNCSAYLQESEVDQ